MTCQNQVVRELRECPITRKQVESETPHSTDGPGMVYRHAGTTVTVAMEPTIFFVMGMLDSLRGYDMKSHLLGRQLIWSYMWRSANLGARPVFVTERAGLRGAVDLSKLRGYHVVAFEDAIEEATALTFEQRAMNTLDNLYSHLDVRQDMPNIPHWNTGSDGDPDFHHRKSDEDDGMAFATTNFEAWAIYNYLFDEGHLRKGKSAADQHRLNLTPKAFATISKLRSGRNADVLKGFFIRRWGTDLDEFYKPILQEVRSRTKCPVEPVWAKPHNEKIDDRIMRELREATVVVADVTGERFNVGLELGYAMGLRKPVVLLRDRSDIKPNIDGKITDDLPFDIRTYNCIFYDREKPNLVADQLSERILSAIADARERAH